MAVCAQGLYGDTGVVLGSGHGWWNKNTVGRLIKFNIGRKIDFLYYMKVQVTFEFYSM